MSLHLLLRSTLVLLGSSSLASAAIVLTNPSFESPNIAAGSASLNGINGSGWTTGSTYLLDNGVSQTSWFSEAVPNGQQCVTLAQNSYFTQQLSDGITGPVLALGTVPMTFDISFFVGRRTTGVWGGAGTFTVHLQEYNGTTFIGDYATQRFQTGTDSDPTTIDLNLPQGFWTDDAVTLSLTVPSGVTAGRNINLSFSNIGAGSTVGEGSIDNVSIALVPEPATALLGSLGLLGLLRRRR